MRGDGEHGVTPGAEAHSPPERAGPPRDSARTTPDGAPSPPAIRIHRAETPEDLDAIRALFVEYVRAPDWEADFATYLVQQAFETELAELPGPYAPPTGALLLARVDGKPAACIAAKSLDPPDVCEMKRLFVRPQFRGLGLGEQLVRQLIVLARGAGYRRMRLDTLPSMSAAQRLYQRLGFREIPPYCENPVRGAHFLERELDADPGSPTVHR